MLGAPGAGKGTQAVLISNELGLAHISSGEIFRENIKNNTELGKEAEEYLSRGDLVPDSLTISMIKERLSQDDCKPGAILDGFPRTPAQAEALDVMLAEFGGKVNLVSYIKVAEDVLTVRLSGRWCCRKSGHIYHESLNPPKQTGICDLDQSELYQRDDDKTETVAKRIQVYLQQTAPLIQHFTDMNLIVEINGDQAIQAVTADLLAALSKET